MQIYLSIGLGVFLAGYTINVQNPMLDLGFFEGIWFFLMTLFVWPLCVLMNLLIALQVRKENALINKTMEQLLSSTDVESLLNTSKSLQDERNAGAEGQDTDKEDKTPPGAN